MLLRIGEVVEKSGLSHDTLRYYERVGLMRAPDRAASGHRVYEASVLDQLAVVTSLRTAGFSIAQVLTVLAVKDNATTVRGRIDGMRHAMSALESALDEKEAALVRARKLLEGWRAELDAGEPWPETPVGCP